MLSQDQQIFKQIEKANNILISFPKEADGDVLANALAWFLFLKKIDKKAEIVGGQESNLKSWSFLPSFIEVKQKLDNLRKFIVSLNIKNAKISQIKYLVENDLLNFIISPSSGWFTHDDISSSSSGFKYDLIIIIGATDLESLGDIYDQNIEFFYKTTIINLDYHPENEEYGQINFIELNTLSVAEISFYLFKNYQEKNIDEDIATCLLAGIIAKTKNFKTPNLTPRALLTTSQLIGLGARREEIVDRLYRSKGLNALKLWGKMLNNLNSEAGNHLIWSSLSSENIIPNHDPEPDLVDIIDELIINIPEAKIIITFYP
ncbi:MAG: DHH family phosphoesterase, partial [Candidatus Falkowbacteria bacterium]|nr:DHH family phosphoesterase [Candidatus Falkowbacteria bacterium]